MNCVYCGEPSPRHHSTCVVVDINASLGLHTVVSQFEVPIQSHSTDPFSVGTVGAEYKSLKIDPVKFLDRFFAVRQDLLANFNHRPKQLLIGVAEYSKLMDEMGSDLRHMVSFTTEYNHWTGTPKTSEIFGLQVTLIPWMEGFVLI